MYIEAAGRGELRTVEALLAPDAQLEGPSSQMSSSAEIVAALRRIGAILVRNEIHRVFADGDEACVIYDFVTDTPIGTVPTIEWLRIVDGRITSIKLFYDRVPWKAVAEELARRVAQTTA